MSLALVGSASISNIKIRKFNDAIEIWKGQIGQRTSLELLDNCVTLISSMIKTFSINTELINGLYSLSVETIAKSDDLYSNFDKESLHKIFSNIYSFSTLFAQNMTNQEQVQFLYSCIACVFKHGTDWSFSNILIESPNDETILEIIEYIGKFFKDGEKLKGKKPLKSFYFYYVELARNRKLIENFLNSEHVMDSLLFIRTCADPFMSYFHQWVKLFFPYIHKVFEGHLESSKVKVLLDLCKIFVEESDVDWAVLIFSANNIADFIYANPLLLAKALDILSFLMEKYTARFMSCVELLGVNRAEKLVNELEKRTIKRNQISASLSVRKHLPQLQLDASIGIEESFKSWQFALEEINKIKLDDLSPEDYEKYGEIIRESFENLYNDFKENETEQVLRVLNAYIPVNAKLNVFFKIGLNIAQEVASKYCDLLATEFSQRKEEINLRDLATQVNNFQGSVLSQNDLFYNLTKFTKYWYMDIFTFKVFVDFLTNLNWYHDRIPLINVQNRVIRYLNSNRKEKERKKLIDFIDYLKNDLRILSKTESLILNAAIGKSN